MGWPPRVAGTVKAPENDPCGEVETDCPRAIVALPKVKPLTWALGGKLLPLNEMEVPAMPVLGLSEKIGMP